MFNAVGLLYPIKIVARFYKVQYEHMKRGVVGCVTVFVANFVGFVSAKNWIKRMTSDYVMTNIKRVTFFETQCIFNKLAPNFYKCGGSAPSHPLLRRPWLEENFTRRRTRERNATGVENGVGYHTEKEFYTLFYSLTEIPTSGVDKVKSASHWRTQQWANYSSKVLRVFFERAGTSVVRILDFFKAQMQVSCSSRTSPMTK